MMSPLEKAYNNLLETTGAKSYLRRWDGDSPQVVTRRNELEQELTRALGDDMKGALHKVHSLHDFLQQLFKVIQLAAAEYSKSPPIDVFVGEFPTGSYNAQAVRVEDGALLLINDGLMTFIHQCAKIYVYSTSFKMASDDETEEFAPILARDASAYLIAEIMISYLSRGHAVFAPRLPVFDRNRFELTSRLSTHAEWFVVGYEYGHVIAGHLTNPKSTRSRNLPNGTSVNFIKKTWEEEFEADSLGLAFLIPPSLRNAPPSFDQLSELKLRIAGPFLFFALNNMLERVIDTLSGTEERFDVTRDHPPTILRLGGLFEALQGDAKEVSPVLSTSARIIEWFESITDEVIEAVQSKLKK